MLLGGDALGRFALGQIGQGAPAPPSIVTDHGGTSYRKGALEPVHKRRPKKAEPQFLDLIPLPVFADRQEARVPRPRPPARIVDPALIPNDLIRTQQQITRAFEDSVARRRQDEQDIADVLAMLEHLDGPQPNES